MTTTTSIHELSETIEDLVREHLEESRRAAATAVERAFGATTRRPTKARGASRTAKTSKRRTPEDVAELGERFYRAVCEQPGETMAVLAVQAGASPRDLHRPMTLLKRAGRIRSAGQRHQTRYFPTTNGLRASA